MGINRKKRLDILDTLTDALGRSDGQSVEEVKEELLNDGMDVDGALSRLKVFQKEIAMAAKRSALDVAREKRLKFSPKGHKFIGQFEGWTKERLLARFKELGGPEVAYAYRDLESMGEEEIAYILEDLELTRARAQEDDSDVE